MSDWNWETRYDRFLSFGSWANSLLYGGPAAGLLFVMYLLGVGKGWWTPILLIYAIAALAHMAGHGFMAVNLQMKVIADRWEARLDSRQE